MDELQDLAVAREPAWFENIAEHGKDAMRLGLGSLVVFPLVTLAHRRQSIGSTRNDLVPYERQRLLRAC